MIFALLFACAAPEEPAPAPEADLALLARVSLDLRGVRPTEAELGRLSSDPDALEPMIAEMLYDPRFGPRVREAWHEVLLTRNEDLLIFERRAIDDFPSFKASVGEEPLRFVEQVAVDDLPWTELVLADWTVVNEHLAAWYPTDYPTDGVGWQVARYVDGRPAVGLMALNGMYWRYPSTGSNKHRKQANAFSRVLTCQDLLQTEVPFDNSVNLLDEEAVEDAISTNPGCVACHQTLDPLASHFYGFGFFYDDGIHVADATNYRPFSELDWQAETGVAPGYGGVPTVGLTDLGPAIARDPRFAACAVEQTWGWLTRAELPAGDALDAHGDAFRRGGLRLRPLVASIVADPVYRDTTRRKLVSPDLLASMMSDLTGFSWVLEDGTDLLASERAGLLTLAGGIDGFTVTRPAVEVNATIALVHERLALAAASHVALTDAGLDVSERRLFTQISPDVSAAADPAAAEAQLRAWFVRILSREATPAELDGLMTLARESEEGDPQQGWITVLSAILRHPDAVHY